MKATDQMLREDTEEAPPPGYREVPWPEHGRKIFGPWCLLGAWPAVFGVVEKIEEPEKSSEEPLQK